MKDHYFPKWAIRWYEQWPEPIKVFLISGEIDKWGFQEVFVTRWVATGDRFHAITVSNFLVPRREIKKLNFDTVNRHMAIISQMY